MLATRCVVSGRSQPQFHSQLPRQRHAWAVGSQPETSGANAVRNQAPDKLLDLPPLKHSQASLIGGSLESIDRVRSRFVLRPFGRGKLTIAFDPRTQFVRGAEVVRVQDMHPGDRVYVETVLDGTAVFAKTVHLPKDASAGTAVGQVIAYAYSMTPRREV